MLIRRGEILKLEDDGLRMSGYGFRDGATEQGVKATSFFPSKEKEVETIEGIGKSERGLKAKG